jgi:CubicO group peptidase (beta-lactamase class C family)
MPFASRSWLSFALLLVLAAPAPAQPLADELDAVLAGFHDARQLNGAVLVAEGDSVLYERGFGEANMAWEIPNAPDTRFRIGSVTKQFTAALVLQLVEEGRLALDGRVTDYLPDYPAAHGDRITVHHLLTHTSGIPSYTSLPEFVDLMRDPYEPDSFLTVFAERELEFDPGSAWAYSNSGYFLLGVLIEAVTGHPYDEVLRDRLLAPLGLTDTGYDHYGAIIERRAEGYVQAGNGYERAAYLDTSLPYAGGMMYSTVRDLHAWNRALYGGALFEQPATLMKMLTPYENAYGYGVGVGDVEVGERSATAIRHSGGINGFSAQLWYLPDEDYTIAVLDNTAGDTRSVVDAVARVLYGQPQPAPQIPISTVVSETLESEGLDAAVAHYRQLKANAPEAYDFGEDQLNRLGYHYLRRGDVDTALRIFQLNVEAYPEASNPYDSLGEAYMEAGDDERAIANYRKALELNPGSTNARQMLRRLGVEIEEADVAVAEDVLTSYVGRYQLQPDFAIEITREGDRLFAQATGQQRFEIFPSTENEFYLKVVDAQLTFNRGDEGDVTSLTLHQNGQHMPAEKVE